jgi:hypothetical protein
MRHGAPFMSAVCFAVALAGTASACTPRPVLLELYQSEGCSSYPPAQDDLNTPADRPDIVALSLGVTSWDHLGWKDSFAFPQFGLRQRVYAAAGGNYQIATPQFCINGQTTVLVAISRRVTEAIAHSRQIDGPMLTITASTLTVGKAQASRAARMSGSSGRIREPFMSQFVAAKMWPRAPPPRCRARQGSDVATPPWLPG